MTVCYDEFIVVLLWSAVPVGYCFCECEESKSAELTVPLNDLCSFASSGTGPVPEAHSGRPFEVANRDRRTFGRMTSGIVIPPAVGIPVSAPVEGSGVRNRAAW